MRRSPSGLSRTGQQDPARPRTARGCITVPVHSSRSSPPACRCYGSRRQSWPASARRSATRIPRTSGSARAFLPHWYACLRALGIRVRGIYACKDTYISTVLAWKPIPWIEEQTGVVYATLKRHYGRWVPRAGVDAASAALDELARGAGLCPPDTARGHNREKTPVDSTPPECRGGESNPYALASGGF